MLTQLTASTAYFKEETASRNTRHYRQKTARGARKESTRFGTNERRVKTREKGEAVTGITGLMAENKHLHADWHPRPAAHQHAAAAPRSFPPPARRRWNADTFSIPRRSISFPKYWREINLFFPSFCSWEWTKEKIKQNKNWSVYGWDEESLNVVQFTIHVPRHQIKTSKRLWLEPMTIDRKMGVFQSPPIVWLMSNHHLLSISETGIIPGIRIWKSTYLNELDVGKPLVGSISQRSGELRLYIMV